jgi:S1-C subfamily serine protease
VGLRLRGSDILVPADLSHGRRAYLTDDATERGYAYIEHVSEGPAQAAGVQAGDLILSVGGVPVVGRAQATAKISSAAGLLTLELARRKAKAKAAAAGGAAPPGPGAFGYAGVD